MSIIDKADGYLGMRFDQELNGPLVAKYYNEGEENINRDPKLKHMLLASRITILFQNFFHRINSESDIDTLTQTNIYNEFSDKKEPLVIYSQIK